MSHRKIRAVAVTSVLVVAAVAAVVSYAHMYELAHRSGEEWRSWLIPLSVDGMLVAATLAIVDRRRNRLPAGWVPWTGLVLGISTSIAANVAAARPDLTAKLVSGWPSVALAVSIETLVVIFRAGLEESTGVVVAPQPAAPVEPPAPSAKPTAKKTPAVKKPGVAEDAQLERARELVATNREGGQAYGRNRLAADLGVTAHKARELLDQIDEQAPVRLVR